MQALTRLEPKPYDPRWFIWTIVFLLVSGVSLASYILITRTQDEASVSFVPIPKVLRK
jgi:hypothetical protein